MESITNLKGKTPRQIREYFKHCSPNEWKQFCKLISMINYGEIPITNIQKRKLQTYKQCMLHIGSKSKKLPLYKRRIHLLKQKGSGIFTALLPLIAAIIASSIS
jgi:hypothetical protein